ncbi:MAG TPA: DinB family protein [Chthonomonadaceae bacterium]|nr:DinB family protein [Chthonomonadaceae bacterium]
MADETESIGVQEVAARLTEKAAHDLAAALAAVPEEKARWEPLGDSRPILEMAVECCLANRMWSHILVTHQHAMLPEGEAPAAYKSLDTLTRVIDELKRTSSELAGTIRAVPDGDLPLVVAFPKRPGAGRPIAECLHHACWNMIYHLGQVAFIQTLYGDWDEHSDTGPFGDTTD